MNVLERTQQIQNLLARIDDQELRDALTALLERSGEMPTRKELLISALGESLGTFVHDHGKTIAALRAALQPPVRYPMSAWHETMGRSVYWHSDGVPDWSGAQSGYNPGDLSNITIINQPTTPALRQTIFDVRPIPECAPNDSRRMPVMVDFVDDMPTIRGQIPATESLHDVPLSDGRQVQIRRMSEEDYERISCGLEGIGADDDHA